ncbi:Alkaline-phosphatase-like, core domain [Phytophthora cactorum]|nr:Alkaline-phosphatase-like, core domain [Phytophthora cactorum]
MTVVKFLHSQIHLQAPQSPLLSGFDNGRVQLGVHCLCGFNQPDIITEARPNILVFFPDELRFDWVNNGTSTDFLQTPNIDSIRERGVHFKRAITASPVCGPSRACFAAASHYEEVGVLTNRYNFPINRMTTYYKLLQEAGYHTMAVGKLDLNKNDTLNSFGWNHEGNLHAEEWGFSDMVNCVGVFESSFLTEPYPNGSYIEPYTDYLLEHNATDIGDPRFYKDTFPNPLPDDLYNDNWVADQALRLLSEKPDDKEWFMIVNWNGPHYPMSITESMYGRMQNRSFPQPVDYTGNFTAEMHNHARRSWPMGEGVPFQPSVNVPLVIAGDVVNASLTERRQMLTDPHERTNLLLSTNTTELAHFACIIQWLLGKGEVVQ